MFFAFEASLWRSVRASMVVPLESKDPLLFLVTSSELVCRSVCERACVFMCVTFMCGATRFGGAMTLNLTCNWYSGQSGLCVRPTTALISARDYPGIPQGGHPRFQIRLSAREDGEMGEVRLDCPIPFRDQGE